MFCLVNYETRIIASCENMIIWFVSLLVDKLIQVNFRPDVVDRLSRFVTYTTCFMLMKLAARGFVDHRS